MHSCGMLDEARHLPLAPPQLSPDLERELRRLCAKRVGHEPNDDKLHGYRQLLWAFVIALHALNGEERRKREARRKAKKSIKRRRSSS